MIPGGPAPFHGVYAATPAPLTREFALDEPSLRALLADLAAVPGLAGFLVNGHAGENASMPLADQRRVAEIAAETVGDRATVICGVNLENSLAAAAHARDLEAAGADFTNVVNMRVCLRDVADFPRFNEAFTEFMQGEKVTRTCIGGTPHRKGVNVEIDCVAMFD